MTLRQHPFEGVLLTVPNLIRCSDIIECFRVEIKVDTTHQLRHNKYDGIRNLYIKCNTAGTHIKLSGNDNPLFKTVLNEPEKWIKFANLDEYNILYYRIAPYMQMIFTTSHPVDIKYENVKIIGNIPIHIPILYQELDKGIFIKYTYGLVGLLTISPNWNYYLEHIHDPINITNPNENNFYKEVADLEQSIASIKSHQLTEILSALRESDFKVDNFILFSSPPIGSCTFDNSRRVELETIIQDVVDRIDTRCEINIVPKMNRVFDEEYRQREIQRCISINSEYHRLLDFIRTNRNNNPVIAYP